MPIVGGKYKNPGWVNNQKPAIGATELNALSATVEKLDADTGSGVASTRIVLAANAWASNRQTVAVAGISGNESDQLITPVPTQASQSAYYDAGIRIIAQGANSLTFSAETVPSTNLSVYVVVQEVG